MPRGLICECIKFDTYAIVSLCVTKINRYCLAAQTTLKADPKTK
jgi:hypothetical protein